LQIILGPRQVGKTTLMRQILDALPGIHHYATADALTPLDYTWIETQWHLIRKKIKNKYKMNPSWQDLYHEITQ